VVQLNSGGTPMTIREVKYNSVVCVWFDAQGSLHEGDIAGDLLK
jgi:uncharacterized protein YodC (DUF2158 family)